MDCPQMLGQHKDTKNDPSFNHGCKTCDMMEECMEHKERLLRKAESELKELKERLSVGDCDYCYSNRIAEMDKTKSEEKALSDKLVKENQELGIKLAKAESELKAIRDRIEAIDPAMICRIISSFVDGYDLSFASVETEHSCCEEIAIELIKQIGGVK